MPAEHNGHLRPAGGDSSAGPVAGPDAEAIQGWLAAQIASILGVDPASIDPAAPFDGYGLSSREAVVLSGDLEDWLGRRLAPTLVYEHPTIAALAVHLATPAQTQHTHSLTPAVTPMSTGQPDVVIHDPIAIVGIGCRFPKAHGPEDFWQLLRDGVDAIGEVPPDRWDAASFYDPDPATPGKMSTRWGGFLDRADLFDARFFGISPREAERMDPQQRLLLETAWESLEHAAIDPTSLAGTQTGVFVGISSNDYALLQYGDLEAVDAYAGTGNAASIAANRLSYALDLRGPSLAIDTACSSSLVAVHLACHSLRSGESDLALAAGVNLMLAPALTIAFSHARMMAADGRCKTFDASADGYVRGEGCGVVVLKRLSDAQRDGHTILAIIRGSAVNQDGRSNGLTAPNGQAQQAVVRAALADAGVTPNDLSYIEAHGAGTSLGDPIEVRALAATLQPRTVAHPIGIGSVKTNIGALEAAAGIAGLIKTTLALRHELIPPHLHLKTLNPHISLEGTPLTIASERRPWPDDGTRRIAGVSSFGFGGTNAHVVLEAAPQPERTVAEPSRPRHLLRLSARDETALRELAARFARHLAGHPEQALADVCFSANTGRAQFDQRLAVSGTTHAELQAALKAFVSGADTPLVSTGAAPGSHRPKIAFVFTGQGAQYRGMARQLYQTQPTFRAAFERCATLLEPELGLDLRELVFDERYPIADSRYPIADSRYPIVDDRLPTTADDGLRSTVYGHLLDQTQYTQPALFAIEYALAELWRAWGVTPDVVMGHSVGEYVAACVAGVFTLEDGLRLIAARARLMQSLPPGGAMATVFAAREQVAAALAPYAGQVEIAAINGPESTVVSGAAPVVAELCAHLAAGGVESRPITVSHAFHSPLMEPILADFEQVAGTVAYRAPAIPLISNLTGRPMEGAPNAAYWRQHLRQPVQFLDGVRALAAQGCDVFLEIGPHPALTALGRRCLDADTGVWLPSLHREREDWLVLLESLATLYVRGGRVDWAGFDRDEPRLRVPLPTYAFQRERYWFASNGVAPVHAVANRRARQPRAADVATPDLRSESPRVSAGRRLDSPFRQAQFETTITPADLETVSTAEALFEAIVLDAAINLFGEGTHAITGGTVKAALALGAGEERLVQTILDPATAQRAICQIFSLAPDARWILHYHAEVVRGESAARVNTPVEITRDALRAAAPDQRRELLATHLRARLAKVLRLAPGRIDLEQSIRNFGLDSIMAIELKGAIERELGLAVPIASLVAGPSLTQLATDLAQQFDEPSVATATVTPRTRGSGAYPLSHGQQALWFQHQMAPASIYNPTYAVRARAELDVPRLRAAFQALVDRHESLRTTFAIQQGEPVQVVHDRAEVAFTVVDAAGWDETMLRAELDAAARAPFDLEHGPLLRIHVFALAPSDTVILMSAHHIAVDLWSNAIIASEIGALYAREGAIPKIAPVTLQYTDYVAWQRDLLAGPEGDRLWAYWRQKLASDADNASPPGGHIGLPTDRPRPAVQTFDGAMHTFRLDDTLTRRIRTLAEQRGVTLYMALLATFYVLLHRYSGQTDITVGTPTTGRSQASLTDMVGYFVNPVALRAQLAGDQPFVDLLDQVRETVLEALAHQDYPIALLVEKLQPERNLSRTPLFQVMFVFQRAHLLADEGLASLAIPVSGNTLHLAGLPLEAVPLDEQVAPFDMTLMMAEADQGLAASITYNTDLYDTTTIERLAGHFTTLLEGITADPACPISRLPLLTAEERRRVLVEFNDTAADLPIEQPIHALFEAQVARTPDAPALRYEGEQLTYGELNRRANQLAHDLRRRGVGPETLVGIYADRSIELIVGLLGVVKAGGAYLPLDPGYPPERLAMMLEDARPAVVVVARGQEPGARLALSGVEGSHERRTTDDGRPTTNDQQPRPALEQSEGTNDQRRTAPDDERRTTDDGLRIATGGWSVVDLATEWSGIINEPDDNLAPAAGPDNLAYVIYTSGSTGKPKGVLLQHRGLCNLVLSQTRAFGITDRSRVLQFASIGFDASLSEIFMALATGGCLVLAPRERLLSGVDLLQLLREEAITAVTLPPSLLALLPPDDLPALQTVISAGEACPAGIARRWATGRRFINAYGPTEATIGPTLHPVDDIPEQTVTVPIGRPIANTQIYLVDPQMQPVPIGIPGELCIGGVGVARGYLNRPELTAERFVDIGPAQSKVYRTGDLGRYLPDGTIEFLGRIDQQVKIRGFRIEPGEVEAALKQHPDVHDCIVLAREDQPGNLRLVAYVVMGVGEWGMGHGTPASENSDSTPTTHDGDPGMGSGTPEWASSTATPNPQPPTPNPQRLRAWLHDRLPEYMIPAAFVPLEALPLSPNGKVDRHALPVPKSTRPDHAGGYARPRNDMERTIAAIWQEALQAEQVGINDNFFDLGGHSLLMARIHDQLQTTLQRTISIVDLFRYPTVGALAEYLSRDPNDQPSLQASQDRAQKQREALQRQRMQTIARRGAPDRRRG